MRAASVSCGGQHSLALKVNGKVYSCGNDQYGQLGRPLGPSEERGTHVFGLVEMPNDVCVTSIACGDTHCLAISGHGTRVWSWGCGLNGRLGHGDTKNSRTPRPIAGLGSLYNPEQPVVSASCGSAHSAVICSDHTCFVWGSNASGQCGGFELPSLDTWDDMVKNRPPDILLPTTVDFPAEKKSRPKKNKDAEGKDRRKSGSMKVDNDASFVNGLLSSRRSTLGGGDTKRSSLLMSARKASSTHETLSPRGLASARGLGSARRGTPRGADAKGKSADASRKRSSSWGKVSLPWLSAAVHNDLQENLSRRRCSALESRP